MKDLAYRNGQLEMALRLLAQSVLNLNSEDPNPFAIEFSIQKAKTAMELIDDDSRNN